MAHIFISYSTHDHAIATQIAKKFHQKGQRTWLAPQLLPGGNYRDEIDQAIRESEGVVVLITPNAAKSEYVTYEWAYGLGSRLPVIPVLLRTTANLHPRLEALHHIDARRGLALPTLLDRIRATIRQRRAEHRNPAATRASIFARFQQNGSRFQKNGREYCLIIGTKNVPEGTERVRYEIVGDETVEEPTWSVPWGIKDFENDDMSLYGDVHIVAKGEGTAGPWRARAKLSEALVRGHGRRAIQGSPALRKALHYIKTH